MGAAQVFKQAAQGAEGAAKLAFGDAVGGGLGDVVQKRGPPQHQVRLHAVEHLEGVGVDLFVVERAALHLVHLQHLGDGVAQQAQVIEQAYGLARLLGH